MFSFVMRMCHHFDDGGFVPPGRVVPGWSSGCLPCHKQDPPPPPRARACVRFPAGWPTGAVVSFVVLSRRSSWRVFVAAWKRAPPFFSVGLRPARCSVPGGRTDSLPTARRCRLWCCRVEAPGAFLLPPRSALLPSSFSGGGEETLRPARARARACERTPLPSPSGGFGLLPVLLLEAEPLARYGEAEAHFLEVRVSASGYRI